ncbi:hypothetical protein [Macrococcoides canis]|uniref:hypothetical protein n=1 Tax=Macrococcoides canis TaxID=1855823 RepID=UPI0020B698B3|nr:hypothetical protein [Macrococcus canis]UTH10798.1 hypothetical protein KFV10_07700 [Macrococcus canis]
MEKVKPSIIKPKGMTFEELIIAYEKQCNMWNELKERLNTSFENSEYFLEGFGFSDVLKMMEQLEKENEQ